MNAVVNVNGVTHIIVFENYSTTPAPLEGQLGLVLNESVSSTNLSAIEVVPVAAAGAVFGILLVIGVIATSIFIAVLIAGRAKFAEFPFFVLVWHMTVANAIHMVMVISTIMPIMLIEIGDDGPQRMWYIWGSRILSLTEQAVLYFTLLMTINRFAVFVFPQLLIAFTHTRVMILSILAWAYIVFIVAWNVYSGSSKTFSKKKLSMQETILGNNFLSTIFTLSSTVLPIVMLAMYGIIFIFIIKKRGACADAATLEKDRSLLWQALAVAVCLELTKFTNMITPLLSGATSWVQWVWTIFSYSTSILNQMINPDPVVSVLIWVKIQSDLILDKRDVAEESADIS
uniref:7TM GPCR domain containing protein n=1 Tax=Haemonchus contortus TaxID=6289 RepID=W6NFX3_HAECO